MKLFISCSRKDKEIAYFYKNALYEIGIDAITVASFKLGGNFFDALKYEINSADGVLILLTKNFLSSAWAEAEMQYILSLGMNGSKICILAEKFIELPLFLQNYSYYMIETIEQPNKILLANIVISLMPTSPKDDIKSSVESRDTLINVDFTPAKKQIMIAQKEITINVNQSWIEKIKNNKLNVELLKPREFEEIVAELYYKMGYSVELTQATRDGGKDIIASYMDKFGDCFIHYIECKKYRADRPIGVSLVKELAATIDDKKVNAGVIVTTSYFSPDAAAFGERHNTRIKLKKFLDLLKSFNN